MRNKKKIIRAATVPMSLSTFLEGSIETLMERYELVLVSSPDKELFELEERYGAGRNSSESSEQFGVGRNSEEGLRVVGVPMERHISLGKDMRALVQLIRVFRRERPVMVHSMTPKAGLLCMVAAWVCRVPRRVHTFTGLVWPTAVGVKRKILMLTDWITCACASHVIPEGQGVKNDLQTYITKKPMRVLGYGNVRGVDMDYWCITPELRAESLKLRESFWLGGHKKDERLFTFVFVGRVVGDKGINELVEAFLKLREHYLNLDNGVKIRLVLVGRYENNLDPVSELTKQRIDSTPSIMAVGAQYGRDLLTYYAASDCFVFPSYREGFPNTVLEAGAMGLPSIVTDINGSREIITGEVKGSSEQLGVGRNGDVKICKNGIIIPSKDADALYEAMLEMIDNPEQTKRMADNARPMIESRYEQSFVRKCQMEFYDEILG